MPPGPLSIVEQAPSHDGAPTYAAYARRWPGKPRPLYAVRIYDTTPGAAAPNRTSEVAKVIQEKTERYRGTADAHDRVEVVAIPMTLDATDQQRADRCREHQLAEVRSRGGSGKEDWGEWALPKLACDDAVYRQAIIIIDQLDNGWEGAFDRPKVPVGRGMCFSLLRVFIIATVPNLTTKPMIRLKLTPSFRFRHTWQVGVGRDGARQPKQSAQLAGKPIRDLFIRQMGSTAIS